MREIKFRGQTRRKGEKVWMNGDPVASNWVHGNGAFVGEGDFSIIYTSNPVEKHTVYTDTVGQFTGFRDDKITSEYPLGQEVYEGDIVRIVDDGEEHIYQVVFDESELDFKATNGKEQYGRNFCYLTCCDEVEVIGNVYDNPELLKGDAEW